MNEQTYCAEICGAKCCHVQSEGRNCPKLQCGNTCSIYSERFRDGEPDFKQVATVISKNPKTRGQLIGVVCARVKKLHEAGQLPNFIAQQCCVIHPEILETL